MYVYKFLSLAFVNAIHAQSAKPRSAHIPVLSFLSLVTYNSPVCEQAALISVNKDAAGS